MHVRPLLLAVAAAFPVLPHAAHAVTAAVDLDEVVVTGTRTPIRLVDSIAPVQVINRDEIERTQASSLPELLRGRAGIDLVNQGGAGKLTTISMRGTESDHVLVLVDGVRMGTATAGLVMFQDLPLEQIDRIEIVRGPRSSLYGSEALGGVIQIFTRRDQGAATPRFSAGFGSHNLRQASAGIGAGGARGWYGVDVAYQRTDGINACRGSATLFAGCFADEPDRDGYRNRSLNLRGGIDLGRDVALEASLLRAESENEYDGTIFGGNESDNLQQAVGTKLTWTVSPRLLLTAQAGRSHDKSDNHFVDDTTPRTLLSEFDTRRDTASLQADVDLATDRMLSLGVDWQDDQVDSTTDYDLSSRDNLGVFAGFHGAFGTHRLQASLRHDDNQQYGTRTTGSLGWGMTLDHGLRLSAGYATGFRAPSFNELYWPGSGNPALGPETSKNINLGIAQAGNGWHWALDAYQTDVDDLIGYDSGFNLIQADTARIRGAELTTGIELAGWDLGVQLSHVDPRNRSEGQNRDNLLTRRARNSGRVDVDRDFGAFRLGATLNGAGHRYDDAANRVRLGGFATTDLRVEYAFAPAWRVQARLANVFDRRYETIHWYNQPGREFLVTVRYAPVR